MTNNDAKPFVKWAGGKRQLLPIINEYIPVELKKNMITRYIEPFVGGGAVLFDIIQKYQFEEIIINDYNQDLMNLYAHIKDNVNVLIDELRMVSSSYLLTEEDERASYFYKIRKLFNKTESGTLNKSVYFLFLNKTCFNGLYRVNAKGEFNVPHGRYKNPMILDENNLIKASKVLSKVKIINGDFTEIKDFVDAKTFLYFDPPYRPLNNTSSFTAYVKNEFNDDEQIRLKEFFDSLDSKNSKLMLSNSDPKNIDINDEFFDDLYLNYNIMRIESKRSINSKANGRGKISELLIRNY